MSNKAQLDTMVVLTTGKQDRGTRATLAFSWACAALAMGRSVSVYLTMDGTVWSTRNAGKNVQVQGFEPIAEYMEQFIALGGRLLVCAPCSQFYCSMEDISKEGQFDEVELVGLATVVGMIESTTNVITF
ncbi:MAG: DsrE family protein [Verrucomicrobiae bacterium]|nr:DsrE family protein [Verrucomicrobiae bacterium]MCP5521035.1 DsrE family protein [Verrucomicrobiales bacterium]